MLLSVYATLLLVIRFCQFFFWLARVLKNINMKCACTIIFWVLSSRTVKASRKSCGIRGSNWSKLIFRKKFYNFTIEFIIEFLCRCGAESQRSLYHIGTDALWKCGGPRGRGGGKGGVDTPPCARASPHTCDSCKRGNIGTDARNLDHDVFGIWTLILQIHFKSAVSLESCHLNRHRCNFIKFVEMLCSTHESERISANRFEIAISITMML